MQAHAAFLFGVFSHVISNPALTDQRVALVMGKADMAGL